MAGDFQRRDKIRRQHLDDGSPCKLGMVHTAVIGRLLDAQPRGKLVHEYRL
jgi:hypothetical protein